MSKAGTLATKIHGVRLSQGRGLIGGNLDTISIESIADDPHSTDTTSKLAAYLLNKHKLTINDLYTHKYFSGKQCPLYILRFGAALRLALKVDLIR